MTPGKTRTASRIEVYLLIPIRIAKQIDSKKPKVHPSATKHAVTEARTYPIVKAEKIVRTTLLEENSITTAAVAMAMAAAT